MQWLRSLIGRYPRHALVLGKALLLAGGILVVSAVFARAGLMNTNSQRAEAKLPPLQTIAEAYPQYPTELVPEGPLGLGVAGVLVLVGVALTGMAEKAGKRRR